jgi:hypothetical protein
MAEEVKRRGLRDRISLRKVIFGAERHSEAMRRNIKEYLGAEDTFDIPGLTELYGPGTGLECPAHEGIHYWADYYILEIIDPETLEPTRPGGGRGNGRHDSAQGSRTADSLPYARPHPSDPGQMRLRQHPPPARQNPGTFG